MLPAICGDFRRCPLSPAVLFPVVTFTTDEHIRTGVGTNCKGLNPIAELIHSWYHPAMSKDVVSVVDAAAVLGVSDRQVRKMIANGVLPSTRLGRSHMIRRADLAKVPKDRKPGPKGKPVKGKSPAILP